jgi:hypothetical protein
MTGLGDFCRSASVRCVRRRGHRVHANSRTSFSACACARFFRIFPSSCCMIFLSHFRCRWFQHLKWSSPSCLSGSAGAGISRSSPSDLNAGASDEDFRHLSLSETAFSTGPPGSTLMEVSISSERGAPIGVLMLLERRCLPEYREWLCGARKNGLWVAALRTTSQIHSDCLVNARTFSIIRVSLIAPAKIIYL